MSESKIRIDISAQSRTTWGSSVSTEMRQAYQIILHAIAGTPSLRESLYLKGGTLMGLAYNSPRRTTDVDFSYTPFGNPDNDTENTLKTQFNAALKRTAAKLGYADIVLCIQSVKREPKNHYPDGRWPALNFKIAYAKRGTKQETRLNNRRATDVVSLEISFNEQLGEPQEMWVSDEDSLLAYSLVDLVAEKYRALLQQEQRQRNRRQDVYDLEFLLRHYSDELKILQSEIFRTLIEKCESRSLVPSSELIDAPSVRERAMADWNTLKSELGPDDPLPDFDLCFTNVASFYQQLPWTEAEHLS